MNPTILSVEDRQAISQLQYFARGVVDGLTGGHHRSPHKGSSLEFKEHRGYIQGDEIKSIDWKLFGKTDRLFIRQYEDETNLRALLLLDQSGSMAYRSPRPQAMSKHDYATRLAACLATLLIEQQDQVGLATFDTAPRQFISPRGQQRHLHTLFQSLIHSRPGGETSLAETLKQVALRFRHRGLLILISDCFDSVAELMSALQLLRRAGHQILVFQVWDRDELEFPFRSRTQFRSLETSAERIVDPAGLRHTYLQNLRKYREELRNGSARMKVEWISCTTDEPCGQVLSSLFGGGQNRKPRHRTTVSHSSTSTTSSPGAPWFARRSEEPGTSP